MGGIAAAWPGRDGSAADRPAPARAEPSTPGAEPGQPPRPNLYELTGPNLTVSFATSSLIGEPQLTLEDATGRRSFAGEVILVEELAIGRLVTVEVEFAPDMGRELFSLLLPAVGRVAVAPEIAALAIYTTEQATIQGPAGIEGAIQLYRVVEVTGTARFVNF
jgi:hypothetical protein